MTITFVQNDPPVDSLFVRLDEMTNECTLCGTQTYNNTEARDAHLQRCSGWDAHCRGKRSRR